MENIFWPQVSEFGTSNPRKNPNPMKNVSRSGKRGHERSEAVGAWGCKAIDKKRRIILPGNEADQKCEMQIK